MAIRFSGGIQLPQGRLEFKVPVAAPPPTLEVGTLIEVITTAGLTSGLKLALDAGDINSYDGTAQDWLDTSGNLGADEFHRGSTTGADSNDPTFNGVAGDLTSAEYFGYDGDDSFRYGAANETWMNNLHKDGAKFTALLWVNIASVNTGGFFGTHSVNSASGFDFRLRGTGKIACFTTTSTGSTALLQTADSNLTLNAWQMIAVSIDETVGAGGGFMYANGNFLQVSASDTFNATYSSPSSDDSAFSLTLGALFSSFFISNNSRMAMVAAWEGTALSKINLDVIFDETKGRFGIV